MESNTHGHTNENFKKKLTLKLAGMKHGREDELDYFRGAHVEGEVRRKIVDKSFLPVKLSRNHTGDIPSFVVESAEGILRVMWSFGYRTENLRILYRCKVIILLFLYR
jgi:hypothetical protein